MRRLKRALTIADIRKQFHRRVPRIVSDYVEGGAEDEITVGRNRDAFRSVVLHPRVLRDVSQRSLSTTVCGQPVSMPVLIAPTGLTGLAHPGGELAAARAAHEAGIAPVISSGSSYTIEEIASGTNGPLWFQLYPWRDRILIGSLMDRARQAGFTALCVTVDVPISGARERDARNGFNVPLRVTMPNIFDLMLHPVWLLRVGVLRRPTLANLAHLPGPSDAATLSHHMNRSLINPANSWAELSWIRGEWEGPLLVKGIMSSEDARRAVEVGVDGIVVSNHGGRQLDGSDSSLRALVGVVAAVDGKVDVLVDGGIRRGTDVVKALALGARACLIGRPMFYGLAAGGEAGVARVLEIFRYEIDRTLALLGCPDVNDLGPQHASLENS